jgi:hypothetical protein
MALDCNQSYFYHNLSADSNGTTLLNQILYISGSGGPAMNGTYCDGTYIYTVSGGLGEVTLVETVSSQGCSGSPATPIPPTQTPIPWICVQLRVNVSPIDRSASDDGNVYFQFYDCSENSQTISYNTNKTNFNTGYCLYTKYPYSLYILVNGNQTAPSDSSINDPYSATSCT